MADYIIRFDDEKLIVTEGESHYTPILQERLLTLAVNTILQGKYTPSRFGTRPPRHGIVTVIP